MTHNEHDIKDDEVVGTEAPAVALDTREDALYDDRRASTDGARHDSAESDAPEISFESEEDLESPALALKKLREKLRICEKEKKDNLDGWQRMRADFANARKEEETRRGEMIKFAAEGLVDDLLPVLDSFSMAFSNKEVWEKVDANWRKGVEYIYAQMYSVLESRGLTEIGKVGEQVDPRLHVAIEEIPVTAPEQSDTIAEVVQKGYRLHNKVIRPAKVKVFGHTGGTADN